MLPESIELKVGSSAQNSLSWSEDGELAVASGEEVLLLLPRRGSGAGGGPAAHPWTETRININAFSDDEWPPQSVPASTNRPFIGREQRTPEVAALAWSAGGLAKHDRAALAVLTTNGFLSLWQPGAEPQRAAGWSKRLAVNLFLARQLRRGERREAVKAFAWKPLAPGADERGQHLAVLTDEALFVIQIFRRGDELSVRFLGMEESPIPDFGSSLADAIRATQNGYFVQWENEVPDWDPSTDEYERCLIHTIRFGNLETYKVRVPKPSSESEFEFRRCRWKIPAHGPLYVNQGDVFYIYQRCLYMVRLFNAIRNKGNDWPSNDEGDEEEPWTHEMEHLDGWDAPTAIANFGSSTLEPGGHSLLLLQPLSFLTRFKAEKNDMNYHNASYDGPDYKPLCNSLLNNQKSGLAKAVENGIEAFSSLHSIGKKVTAKFHGLATYGDDNKTFAAILASYWPSEQIVYQIKANERRHLILSHIQLEDPETSYGEPTRRELPLPWQDNVNDMPEDWANTDTVIEGWDLMLPDISNYIDEPSENSTAEYWLIVLLQLCTQLAVNDMYRCKKYLKYMDALQDGGWSNQVMSSVSVEEVRNKEDAIVTVNAILVASEKFQPSLVEKCSIPGCSQHLEFQSGDNVADGAVCKSGHVYGRSG